MAKVLYLFGAVLLGLFVMLVLTTPASHDGTVGAITLSIPALFGACYLLVRAFRR